MFIRRLLVLFIFILSAAVLNAPAFGAEEEEAAPPPPDCAAYAADVQGDVQYTEDEEEWVPLEINMCVYPGDIIKTGADSAVSLILGKETALRINANADFQLWNEDEDSDLPNEVDLDLGEALTTIEAEEEGKEVPFAVNTPSGVVGVKGTEFYVKVDDEGKSEIKVLSGIVEVMNELGTVFAEAGMATELLAGMMPADPFGFDMAQFSEALEWANALKTGNIKGLLKKKLKEEVKKRVINSVLGGGMGGGLGGFGGLFEPEEQ